MQIDKERTLANIEEFNNKLFDYCAHIPISKCLEMCPHNKLCRFLWHLQDKIEDEM